MVISEELLRPKDITVNIAFHYGILGKSFGLEQLFTNKPEMFFSFGISNGPLRSGPFTLKNKYPSPNLGHPHTNMLKCVPYWPIQRNKTCCLKAKPRHFQKK